MMIGRTKRQMIGRVIHLLYPSLRRRFDPEFLDFVLLTGYTSQAKTGDYPASFLRLRIAVELRRVEVKGLLDSRSYTLVVDTGAADSCWWDARH